MEGEPRETSVLQASHKRVSERRKGQTLSNVSKGKEDED